MRVVVIALALLCGSLAAADKLVTVRAKEIVLAQPVYFEFGKAKIKPASYRILDLLAVTLAKDHTIGLVEIGVHTDARGNDDWNLELSQARAEAVHAYLVGKGVDAGRLRAKGYGETKPIDKGTSAAAMARNRRTVFAILQRTTT